MDRLTLQVLAANHPRRALKWAVKSRPDGWSRHCWCAHCATLPRIKTTQPPPEFALAELAPSPHRTTCLRCDVRVTFDPPAEEL